MTPKALSRQIKFRMWSIKDKFMDDTPVVYKGAPCTIDTNGKVVWMPQDDTVLMQYTGLHDKNGKEIYEGDIVVWHDSSENIDRGWSRTAVVRINPDLYFQCFKVGGKPHDHDFHYGNFIWKETDKYFEIIGNIYETPELLTKENN